LRAGPDRCEGGEQADVLGGETQLGQRTGRLGANAQVRAGDQEPAEPGELPGDAGDQVGHDPAEELNEAAAFGPGEGGGQLGLTAYGLAVAFDELALAI